MRSTAGVSFTEGTVSSGGSAGQITVLLTDPAQASGTTSPVVCDALVTPGGYQPGQRVTLLMDATGRYLVVLGVMQ